LEGTSERCEGTSRPETGVILKTLEHKKWGVDKKMLLRIHRIIVLRGKIYRTATKPALKTLEPIHNKSVKLA
jgi:hypothetical protein